MNDLEQGSIVLVDFTFSDHRQSKLRPALIISNSKNNRLSRDVIVMKITSKKPLLWGISITNEDLVAGSLDCGSFVQVDAIYSLEKQILRETIGMLSEGKLQEIHSHVTQLFAMKPAPPRK